MRCAALDLGRDLAEQDLAGGDCDLVVAGVVPGGAALAAHELGALRGLLKPGGDLRSGDGVAGRLPCCWRWAGFRVSARPVRIGRLP